MDLGLSDQASLSMLKLIELGSTAIGLLEDQLEWHCTSLKESSLRPSIELARSASHMLRQCDGRLQRLLEEVSVWE
jgi:hypothetical protein